MASLGSLAGFFFAGLLVGQAALILFLSLVRQNGGERELSVPLAAVHDELKPYGGNYESAIS